MPAFHSPMKGTTAGDVTLFMSDSETNDPRDGNRPIELIQGSGPQLTAVTRQLLQCRLKLASLVMFLGFGAFLARNLIWPPDREFSALLFGMHLIVTTVLGFFGFALCRPTAVSTTSLRIQELVIFGLPAAFLLLFQQIEMTQCAQHGFLPSPSSSWLLLMFTYAFLIPNLWQRASVVIGAMALAPVALILWLIATNEVCRAATNGTMTYVTNQAMSLGLGALIAIVGVRTIRLLRSEAFEARQMGQYRLRKLIGRGGMGDVYLGEHRLMRRPCAIKVIQPDRVGDPRALARFEREVRSIARLSHWNSVDIFDYGHTSDGTFYYVMEFLPGLSLQELVDRYGPMRVDRAIYLLRQVCEALSEAHQAGLVHRDIKPANIFSAERGGQFDVAKLLDFGLAKPVVDAQTDASDTDVTIEGVISGSPLYMSPEQALGDTEPDRRSDIYALGAVAYFLTTGRPPFESDKALKIILAHAHQELTPLSDHDVSIPDDFERIVMRCLSKQPEDRFQSIEELGEALERCADADRWTRADAQSWWHERDRRQESASVVAAAV